MRNIRAVLMKQILDTVKNKTVFIQFLMLPILALVMESAIKLPDMPERFFSRLFAVMFVGMAPLTCMSAIIAEEKEQNTLRALVMCGVKPRQYLFATGAYVFILCMAGTAVFAALGGYRGGELGIFLFTMSAGILLSEVVGAAIGIFSAGQMAATSLTLPVMMIFSFVPMLSMFNETVRKFAGILYTRQISDIINGIGDSELSPEAVAVIAGNFIVGLGLFAAAYRRWTTQAK